MCQQSDTTPSHRFWTNLSAGIRKALCGMIISALCIQPVLAARNVPVQIDGKLMETRAYVEDGVTYVPLRSLLDTFGGWDIAWDHQNKVAVAESAFNQLTADPDADMISLNGIDFPARITVEDGRTYVPLRKLTEALGGKAEWDTYLGGAAVTSPDAAYDAADLYWLSRIIYAESGAEPEEGQIAVGNVILNRVKSGEFPDTISDVIFDRVDGIQFEPVENGSVYKTPSDSSVSAAKQVLDGADVIGDAMYFYAPTLSEGIWINANRTYFKTIGCHRFYL